VDIDLKTLPPSHPLRNTPLAEIGAHYRPKDSVAWRAVFPTFGIAKKTFNQLSEVWTKNDDWKATKEAPDTSGSATSGSQERLST
jgi:hypothetical protein